MKEKKRLMAKYFSESVVSSSENSSVCSWLGNNKKGKVARFQTGVYGGY